LRSNVAGLPVTVVHAAISDSTGNRTLYRSDKSSWGNSLKQTLPWQEPVTVPSMSLDVLLDTHGLEHVDLLKMDIEGAEWQVLETGVPARITAIVGEIHAVGDRRPEELLERISSVMETETVRRDASKLVFVARRL
jgi:FkbM family methyltransferase